jgi:DNA-binding response OmpR family regulator
MSEYLQDGNEFARLRVLVADDEEDIRRLTVFTLKRRGFTVLEAAAGDTALELIRRELPDLVVLDVMMPGLDGLQVAGAMRGDPTTAAIPIIMLSAKGQVPEIEAGIASGAVVYLVKPFSPRELADRVTQTLAERSP